MAGGAGRRSATHPYDGAMSGPLPDDAPAPDDASVPAPTVEVTESREALVGRQRVRRALPRRARRTVGSWCFVDHLGPGTPEESAEVGIGPHPHIGLQTVTWLVDGQLRHRDSLGSDQVIRPGELNLMTAGGGVAHAEEATAYRGRFEGVQLWVAQPERTRHGATAFEHHAELPALELERATATVLVGRLGATASPARRDTDHLGIDLVLRPGTSVLPVDPAHELALVVLEGAALVDGVRAEPGHLAYLGLGRDELPITVAEPTRAVLIGGVPFEFPVVMWWNFVARDADEVKAAKADWNGSADRFGRVTSVLDRIPAPDLPWPRSHPSG